MILTGVSRRNQPLGLAWIDPKNKFGVTALSCGDFVAFVNAAAPVSVSSNATRSFEGGIVSFSVPNDTSTYVGYGNSNSWRPAFPFTIAASLITTNDNSVSSDFISSSAGTSATNYSGWNIRASGSNSSFKTELRLGDNAGIGSTNRSTFAHSVRITENAPHILGAIVRSISDADVILDNAFETPTRSGSALSMEYSMSSVTGFGPNVSTSAAQPLTTGWLLVCNRALTKAEYIDLTQNPWQVLLAPRKSRRRLFSVGAAGYTHPTLSNARMGGIVTTGGIPLVDYTF